MIERNSNAGRCPILILSRKINERVIITVPPSSEPQTIAVMLCEILGEHKNKVRLGFDADREIEIQREENIVKDQQRAAKPGEGGI